MAFNICSIELFLLLTYRLDFFVASIPSNIPWSRYFLISLRCSMIFNNLAALPSNSLNTCWFACDSSSQLHMLHPDFHVFTDLARLSMILHSWCFSCALYRFHTMPNDLPLDFHWSDLMFCGCSNDFHRFHNIFYDFPTMFVDSVPVTFDFRAIVLYVTWCFAELPDILWDLNAFLMIFMWFLFALARIFSSIAFDG